MAGLLLCLAVSPLVSGCLLPQDDQVFLELPPRRNSPPRIVTWQPDQQPVGFKSGTGCTNPQFSVNVSDDDQGDALRAYWFIDRTQDSTPYVGSTVFGGTSTTRSVQAPSGGRFGSDLSNLSTGSHVVSVFVTDGDFGEIVGGNITASRPPRLLPDGGLVDDVAYVDTFSWVLEVTPCL